MIARSHELVGLYPPFAALPQEELRRTLSELKPMCLEAGTVVFDEMQRCDAFPFVLRGELKVSKRSDAGREIALYTVGAGDACVVSAACVLGSRPYNAFGVAIADCELALMPAHVFDRLMILKPFREAIFALFSQRVVELMMLVEEVAFRKLDQRLARLLATRGPNLEVSHQALADELGTVREMITRTLNAFADRGWVRLTRGSINVLDGTALAQLAAIGSERN